MEQWLGKSLTKDQEIKCEEIVTNYWLAPTLKYLDRLFSAVDPNAALFFLHMDNNVLNRCRCHSEYFKFSTDPLFKRWYIYFDKYMNHNISNQDVLAINRICRRYEFKEFIDALNKSSIKKISYVEKVLESEGHRHRLLKKPCIVDKESVDVSDAKSMFEKKLEEQDIKVKYDSDRSN